MKCCSNSSYLYLRLISLKKRHVLTLFYNCFVIYQIGAEIYFHALSSNLDSNLACNLFPSLDSNLASNLDFNLASNLHFRL